MSAFGDSTSREPGQPDRRGDDLWYPAWSKSLQPTLTEPDLTWMRTLGLFIVLGALYILLLNRMGGLEWQASHMYRYQGALLPFALGLYLAVRKNASVSIRRRIGLLGVGLAVGIAAWWLVPTTNGLNLVAARSLVAGQEAELTALPPGDGTAFQANATARQRLDADYPSLAQPLGPAEMAWVNRTLQAAQSTPTGEAPAGPAGRLRAALTVVLQVQPNALRPYSVGQAVRPEIPQYVGLWSWAQREGLQGERPAVVAHYRRAAQEIEGELSAWKAAEFVPMARALLSGEFAAARLPRLRQDLETLRQRASTDPQAAFTELSRLLENATDDQKLAGTGAELPAVRERIREELTEVRRRLLAVQVATTRPGFDGNRAEAAARLEDLVGQIRAAPEVRGEPDLTAETIGLAHQAFAEARAQVLDARLTAVRKKTEGDPASAVQALLNLVLEAAEERAAGEADATLAQARSRVRTALADTWKAGHLGRLRAAEPALAGPSGPATAGLQELLTAVDKDPVAPVVPEAAEELRLAFREGYARGRVRHWQAALEQLSRQAAMNPAAAVPGLKDLLGQVREDQKLVAGNESLVGLEKRVGQELLRVRQRAFDARLEATRQEAQPLIQAERYQAAAGLARKTAADLTDEAKELNRTDDLIRFRDSFEFAAKLARVAGQQDPP